MTNEWIAGWVSHPAQRPWWRNTGTGRATFASSIKLMSLTIASIILLAMATEAISGDLVQERQYLRVKIGGKDVRLEALFVKRADARGRLPIALFNHGRPAVGAMALDR